MEKLVAQAGWKLKDVKSLLLELATGLAAVFGQQKQKDNRLIQNSKDYHLQPTKGYTEKLPR